jgi:hypothetical protein
MGSRFIPPRRGSSLISAMTAHLDSALSQSNYHAWIFVSHASDDLVQVRKVRNYLEEKGASPLLFHLLALKDPEEFWPIIAKEIEARNFFLFCESDTARTREWVRREREAVEAVAKTKPVRIGTIEVDRPELDLGRLDALLATIRVFPSFSPNDVEHVRPYLDALKQAGFQVFEGLGSTSDKPDTLRARMESSEKELIKAAREGFVVLFVSSFWLANKWNFVEFMLAQNLEAKVIPVAIEPTAGSILPSEFPPLFDGTREPTEAPNRLAVEMLRRRV